MYVWCQCARRTTRRKKVSHCGGLITARTTRAPVYVPVCHDARVRRRREREGERAQVQNSRNGRLGTQGIIISIPFDFSLSLSLFPFSPSCLPLRAKTFQVQVSLSVQACL